MLQSKLFYHFTRPFRRSFSHTSVEKAKVVRQLSESRAFTVRQIIDKSETQNLNTIKEDSPLSDAASLMVKEEVGSLMVTDSTDLLAGIITERDYLRASQAADDGAISLVRDIMTPREQLVTVTADASITECVTLMAQHQFRHLPVLEDEKLVGMINSRALLVRFLEYHEIQVAHLENFLPYKVW